MNRDIAPAAEVLSKNTLAFVASPQVGDDVFAPLEEEGGDDVTVLEDTFVAASENGFMLRRGDEADVDVYRTWCPGEPHLVELGNCRSHAAHSVPKKNQACHWFRP
jgi:hypothetical protein